MNDVKFTEQEVELILAIRNYQKSYPNGYPQLLYYVISLFEQMIDMPKE